MFRSQNLTRFLALSFLFVIVYSETTDIGFDDQGESLTPGMEREQARGLGMERELTVSSNATALQIESTRETSDPSAFNDSLSYLFQMSDPSDSSDIIAESFVNFVAFRPNANIDATRSLRLISVVEYMESGATAGFDSADRVVSEWPPADATAVWSDLVVTNRTLVRRGSNRRPLRIFEYEAASSDGVMTINGVSASGPMAVGPRRRGLSPNRFKLTFTIQNFPYLENGTSLAVLMEMGSEREFEDLRMENSTENGTDADNFNEAMSNDATLESVVAFDGFVTDSSDGEIPIVITGETSSAGTGAFSTLTRFYASILSTDNEDMLVWDPEVGVSAIEENSAYSASKSLLLPVFALLLLWI